MILYQWQEKCLKSWKDNGCRGIVQAVTGAGKTRLALKAIDEMLLRCPDLVIRIVVPGIPLAGQWERALLHHVESEDLRPGLFGAGRRDAPDRKVMIYIINSARTTLAGHIRRELSLHHPVLLICDECHHYQSAENRKIFSFLTAEIKNSGLFFSLGLSATPFGTRNDSVLRKALGSTIYQYGFDDAVEDGVIAPFVVCEISSSFFGTEFEEYQGLSDKIRIALIKLLSYCPRLKNLGEMEFMRAVTAMAHEADMDPENPAVAFLLLTWERKKLSNLAQARIACGTSLIERLTKQDRILVFCERISQAEDMVREIRRKFGNICGVYHSQMTKDAQSRALSSFREGEIRILVSCRCLDEGIDVPDANIGIVLSSSAVERQRIQRLGRVVRRAEGKSAACLYYIYIRESTDDAAYLKGLENYESFSLRYYTEEGEFAGDLYEYASSRLLERAGRAGLTDAQLKEFRRCLVEGLVRADFLLSDEQQTRFIQTAQSRHERNYWKVMKKIGKEFRS